MKSENVTWQEMKELCNSLPESELQKVIMISDGEYSTQVTWMGVTDEDYYYDPNDIDDCGTLRDLKDLHGDDLVIENYKMQPKGTAFISTESI